MGEPSGLDPNGIGLFVQTFAFAAAFALEDALREA